MSRPRPLAPAGLPFGLKLMTAGLAGLLGSTLGIMVGSLIGSWSIKHNLVDAER
jgi:hypothetical protein